MVAVDSQMHRRRDAGAVATIRGKQNRSLLVERLHNLCR
jgi:hypothetical protein